MFSPDTPLTLLSLSFGVDEIDEESRRVVVATFGCTPFSPALADELGVRSLLFDASSGTLKSALESVTANIHVDDQRVSIRSVPDADVRLVLMNVAIDDKLKAKVKRDREPAVCEAIIKLRFAYPTADQLLTLANAVSDTLYLTFEPEQGDLLTAQDDAEPIRRRPRGTNAAATTH